MEQGTERIMAHNALMERRSPEIGKLTAKMAAALGAVGAIEHDSRSQTQGYSYTSFDAIAGRLRPILAKLGLAIYVDEIECYTVRELQTKSGSWPIVRVVADVTFCEAESGQFQTVRFSGEGADPGDKAVPKAQTMLLKYLLKAHFLISTGNDDAEADERTDKAAAEAPAKPVQRRGKAPAAAPAEEPEEVRYAKKMNALVDELTDILRAGGKPEIEAAEEAAIRRDRVLESAGVQRIAEAGTTELRVKIYTAMKDTVESAKKTLQKGA